MDFLSQMSRHFCEKVSLDLSLMIMALNRDKSTQGDAGYSPENWQTFAELVG